METEGSRAGIGRWRTDEKNSIEIEKKGIRCVLLRIAVKGDGPVKEVHVSHRLEGWRRTDDIESNRPEKREGRKWPRG